MAGNYGGLGEEFSSYESSPIVVLPIPYDGTSTWIKGSENGPSAIIEASANMELYDIDTGSNIAEHGIHTAPPVDAKNSPEETVREVERRATELAKGGKFVVGLGGEHSVSVGLVKAQKGLHPGLTVLYLDAHADLRDSYLSGKYDHACAASRIRELCPVVQVGVRSMSEEELGRVEKERMFFAKDMQGDWMNKVIALLGEEVYVTIDLDVLDPSEMPSVGTPEPGGLRWHQLTELLSRVAEEKRVVGFDIVELCPNPHNKAPDFLASKLAYVFLSQVFARGSRKQ